jgi:uracil-DNA glycosylase family 4
VVRSPSIRALAQAVTQCRLCPRLVEYREEVARARRRAYREWLYWGRPVPGFGDPQARLLVLGLAPAAHGGNRTGRVFTGDRSGDWLYRTLHRFGFANQPTSVSRDDGLQLQDAYVAAAVRCAPPDNKPTPDEFETCRPYLVRELQLLRRVRVVIVLGAIAFDAFWRARIDLGDTMPRPKPKFAHRGEWKVGDLTLLACYHPSQRNTQTGFLTEPMFDSVFARARRLLGEGAGGSLYRTRQLPYLPGLRR